MLTNWANSEQVETNSPWWKQRRREEYSYPFTKMDLAASDLSELDSLSKLFFRGEESDRSFLQSKRSLLWRGECGPVSSSDDENSSSDEATSPLICSAYASPIQKPRLRINKSNTRSARDGRDGRDGADGRPGSKGQDGRDGSTGGEASLMLSSNLAQSWRGQAWQRVGFEQKTGPALGWVSSGEEEWASSESGWYSCSYTLNLAVVAAVQSFSLTAALYLDQVLLPDSVTQTNLQTRGVSRSKNKKLRASFLCRYLAQQRLSLRWQVKSETDDLMSNEENCQLAPAGGSAPLEASARLTLVRVSFLS